MAPLLGLLCILSLLGFAFFGFFVALTRIFTPTQDKPSNQHSIGRSIDQDVLATSYLLNHLLREKKISEREYNRLRNFLEKEFAANQLLSRRAVTESAAVGHPGTNELQKPIATAEQTNLNGTAAPAPPIVAEIVAPRQPEPRNTEAEKTEKGTGRATPTDERIPAQLTLGTEQSALAGHSHSSDKLSNANTQRAALSQSPLATPGAPLWATDEQPHKAPRKTFKELMSGFMLEKNIRWGELASGILIVGSAVGLITSLREELRNTIPYFSSLLFLLVTAAIHGAGIYTLKKWNLRNTSRGTLLIGLLLIPLNFVAACVLSADESQRRSLTDPWLWTAVSVGLVGFSVMAWNAGKCLFRRGQLALTLSLLGSGMAIVLINRLPTDSESVLPLLLVGIPMVASFLVGVTGFRIKHCFKHDWTIRTSYRLLTFLGIATFAFLVCSGFVLVRNGQWFGLVALSPALCAVALACVWIGSLLSRNDAWNAQVSPPKELNLAAISIQVLGGLLALVAWGASFANTSTLIVCSSATAILLFLMTWLRREPRLLPIAWLTTATGVFCAVNLYLQVLPWNAWVPPLDIVNTILSGQTGLTFLAVGAGTLVFHKLLLNDSSEFNQRSQAFGLLSGATVLATGCLIALVASFVHPQNQFDNSAASVLLCITAILSSAGTALLAFRAATGQQQIPIIHKPNQATLVGGICSAIVACTMMHCFAWNPLLSRWLNNFTYGIDANWSFVCFGVAVWLSLLSIALRAIQDGTQGARDQLAALSKPIVFVSALASIASLASSLLFIRAQTGVTTLIACLACLAWLGITWSKRGTRQTSGALASVFWLGAGAACSCALVEIFSLRPWCPPIDTPEHWLLQITLFSLGLFSLEIFSAFIHKRKSMLWIVAYDGGFEGTLATLLALTVAALTFTATIDESLAELFVAKTDHLFSNVVACIPWLWVACFATCLALGFAIFKQPSASLALPLVLLWFSAWSSGSHRFAPDLAVASAVRWALPFGGLVGALALVGTRRLVPLWAYGRNILGFSGRSTWSTVSTQRLINIALGIPAFALVAISTTAIAQVVMHGGADILGGPATDSLFGKLSKEISYGVPVGVLVGTCLFYAITERRPWLATAGSLVFQYCVVLSIILLITSPHPKLASSWFINILQTVSVGMTFYGFSWWYFKDQITNSTRFDALTRSPKWRISQLQTHVLLNGLLLTSLAVMVTIRITRFPDQPTGWISSIGSLTGLATVGLYSALVYFVWHREFRQVHRASSWLWLQGWLGFVLVAQIAAYADRVFAAKPIYLPWASFDFLVWGSLIVAVTQVALYWTLEARSISKRVNGHINEENSLHSLIESTAPVASPKFPILASTLLTTFYCYRGMLSNPNEVWWYTLAVAILVLSVTAAGIIGQSALVAFTTATVGAIAAILFVFIDPESWFTGRQPYIISVPLSVVLALSSIWLVAYLYSTLKKQSLPKANLVWLPNIALLGAATWLLFAAGLQLTSATLAGGLSFLNNPAGAAAIVLATAIFALQLWNGARKGIVIAGSFLLFSQAILACATLVSDDNLRGATATLSLSIIVATLGYVWKTHPHWLSILKQLYAPSMDQLQQSMRRQLPVLGAVFGVLAIGGTFLNLFTAPDRAARFIAAMSPFAIAYAFGCWSDMQTRRWFQSVSLALVTLGAIFVSWAEVSPQLITSNLNVLLIRTLLVLAGAMFVYGGLVSRWVRRGDRWLQSLREMSAINCALAIVCFVLVVFREGADFVPGYGCGTSIANAVAMLIVVVGMIAGLIYIAIRPKQDPFSLSVQGRMGYVYAAQAVATLLILHLYFSMPQLFRFGLQEFWPYFAMLVSFAGVGIANLLQRRKLEVLGQPLFTTASILPIGVAAGIWFFDSQADPASVILSVSLAYLLISYLRKSLLYGALALLLGNAALWMFYGRFNGLGLFDHPQLWLIPPALSVLIASQIVKSNFNASQLAAIRYLSTAVIYISSTSEVLLHDFGETLWPPLILASLAIVGILVGIMVQVRAYLYLGSIFLLTSMIAMVSHAHNRFDHVWPWWAFGITSGITILVLFGLFEKRRKDMKAVMDRLQNWEM